MDGQASRGVFYMLIDPQHNLHMLHLMTSSPSNIHVLSVQLDNQYFKNLGYPDVSERGSVSKVVADFLPELGEKVGNDS